MHIKLFHLCDFKRLLLAAANGKVQLTLHPLKYQKKNTCVENKVDDVMKQSFTRSGHYSIARKLEKTQEIKKAVAQASTSRFLKVFKTGERCSCNNNNCKVFNIRGVISLYKSRLCAVRVAREPFSFTKHF